GYSVTMPGKFAALGHASVVSDRARIVGSANTLVRHADGWYADCTDVDGATGALAAFGDLPARPAAVVLGVGGTARPGLAGLAALGGVRVVLASHRDNAGPAADCGRALGLDVSTVLLTDPSLPGEIARADVTVNTVPEPGVRDLTGLIAGARRPLDVLSARWPSAAGAAALAAGAPGAGAGAMLPSQACGQVELSSGLPAPGGGRAAALPEARGRRGPRRCRDAERAGLMCPGDA